MIGGLRQVAKTTSIIFRVYVADVVLTMKLKNATLLCLDSPQLHREATKIFQSGLRGTVRAVSVWHTELSVNYTCLPMNTKDNRDKS